MVLDRMPLFFVKREFFDAIVRGEKKAEIRVGPYWKKVAEKILKGESKPIAIFKWRNRTLLREIYRIEIYPSIRRALANGRWKLLGLKAKTYQEAIMEISTLYRQKVIGPSVIFWFRKVKDLSKKM